MRDYKGEIKTDRYGRKIPKHAHGTENIGEKIFSSKSIVDTTLQLYDRIINKNFLVRRISLCANHVMDENIIKKEPVFEQLDLFTDYAALMEEQKEKKAKQQKERKLQEAMLDIKRRYGKNAVLKGTNLVEGATAVERNDQIGGHKA